jgi:hypothetical protein
MKAELITEPLVSRNAEVQLRYSMSKLANYSPIGVLSQGVVLHKFGSFMVA